jgi:hypothetical protein
MVQEMENFVTDANGDGKQKTFLGMPMSWDRKKPFRNLWNSKNGDVFPPKSFGIGWTINFHALFRRFGIIKNQTTKSSESKDRM